MLVKAYYNIHTGHDAKHSDMWGPSASRLAAALDDVTGSVSITVIIIQNSDDERL